MMYKIQWNKLHSQVTELQLSAQFYMKLYNIFKKIGHLIHSSLKIDVIYFRFFNCFEFFFLVGIAESCSIQTAVTVLLY